MIQIQSFTFNAFQENTYLLYDETQQCVVIDPGCYDCSEQEELAGFIREKDLKVVQLLNTHCHIDHVLGNAFVKRKYDVPLLIHEIEVATLRAVVNYAPVWGFSNYEDTMSDGFLREGQTLRFGDSALEILFVPGHAPGHVAFVNPSQRFCIGGDVLFRRSIGRTDLPGGDFQTLIRSIHGQLFPLGDDFVVYPGHGENTTIGEEKRLNPFCAAQ
jgi:glyoxylase-like metal-dependent hydrolase (beta-lactamase superfamily II)